MVVWCTQNVPRQQQFYVAPAMPAQYVHHFGGYSQKKKTVCYEKLVMYVESLASAMSLLKSYIKAINMSITLSSSLCVCPPPCVSVLSVHLSPYICLHLAHCMSITLFPNLCVCPPLCVSVHPSVYLSVCLSMHLSTPVCVCPSISPPLCGSVHLSTSLCVHPSVYLCVCLSIHLSTSVCPSICLPLCLSIRLSTSLPVPLSVPPASSLSKVQILKNLLVPCLAKIRGSKGMG